MSLLDLKRYMQQHQFADLHKIAQDLQLSEDAVAHMMTHLERKGLVKKLSSETHGCSSCTTGCNTPDKVLYCWCRK